MRLWRMQRFIAKSWEMAENTANKNIHTQSKNWREALRSQAIHLFTRYLVGMGDLTNHLRKEGPFSYSFSSCTSSAIFIILIWHRVLNSVCGLFLRDLTTENLGTAISISNFCLYCNKSYGGISWKEQQVVLRNSFQIIWEFFGFYEILRISQTKFLIDLLFVWMGFSRIYSLFYIG